MKKPKNKNLWERLKEAPKYKDLKLEDITKAFEEFIKATPNAFNDFFVKKLTPEEVEDVNKMAGGLMQNMGDELYRLPGGAITGPGGLKLYNEALQKQIKNVFRTK